MQNYRFVTAILMVCIAAACQQQRPEDAEEIARLNKNLAEAQVSLEQADGILVGHKMRVIEMTPGASSSYPDAVSQDLKKVEGVNIGDFVNFVAKGPAACPAHVNTFVRAERGKDCDTYMAEVAGWADKCVVNRNDVARLAEATADAANTCAAWCASKNCPGPRYAPPQNCATANFRASKDCPGNCPNINECFLLQSSTVWNCQCIDI